MLRLPMNTALWPLLVPAVACGPHYQSPCSPRPGFDQVVPRHEHPTTGDGSVYIQAPKTRDELPGTLNAVAEALRKARGDKPVDVHADIPLAFFEGLSCQQILTPFDRAGVCSTMPSSAMISFYYLPESWLGGGRELSLHFDDSGRCDGARWCGTQ